MNDKNVYVIDDDDAMRDSMDFLLGAAGFTVVVFDSAASFLEKLPGMEFGCVVSDVRMAGIDGIELLKRIQGGEKAFPVVMMTGHGDIRLAVEAMKIGATDFLEKPFDDERLIGTIEEALQRRNQSPQSSPVNQEIAARIESLSSRERQVMEGLVAGLSNKIIAREYDISPRTIEVYRANVMTKMQANSVSELVRLAIKGGMIQD